MSQVVGVGNIQLVTKFMMSKGVEGRPSISDDTVGNITNHYVKIDGSLWE